MRKNRLINTGFRFRFRFSPSASAISGVFRKKCTHDNTTNEAYITAWAFWAGPGSVTRAHCPAQSPSDRACWAQPLSQTRPGLGRSKKPGPNTHGWPGISAGICYQQNSMVYSRKGFKNKTLACNERMGQPTLLILGEIVSNDIKHMIFYAG